jgi:hypothetical protein
MEVAAVVLAGIAILLVIGIEWLKRPRLEIVTSPFSPSSGVPFTFAAVQVRNKPLGRPWRWFLSRSSASGCRAAIDFFRWSSDERVMPPVPGRWSSHPEPLRSVPTAVPPVPALSASSSWTVITQFELVYDPTLDPPDNDVRASVGGEEMAVAVLTQHGAFAWGTESYTYDEWAKPEWKLDHGTYRVVIRVEGSSVSKTTAFKLEYLDEDFAKFRLQLVEA